MSDPVLIALIVVVGVVVSIIAWKGMEIGQQAQIACTARLLACPSACAKGASVSVMDDRGEQRRSEGAGNKPH